MSGLVRKLTVFFIVLTLAQAQRAVAAPATLLFEDDFNRGIPGWTQVQPAGTYLDGPMRWQYDIVSGSFLEQSNIYTDAAAASPSATAVMLINDAAAGTNLTYKARLIAGDDDAFGLIFGYRNPTNFFRVTFTRQRRTAAGYPWNGWNVDRKINNVATNLFGDGVDGVPDAEPSFRNTQYQPFDVTIAANNGLFSLTVLDDPEGAPVEYKLVEAQPITGIVASGKVGMVQWGQSGTALRGFRIKDPVLAPVALSGNPNALTNWTAVVPPRTGGDNTLGGGNSGVPIWSLALGQTGPFGTLHENSGSFGGDDVEGRIDFTGPTIVAGDVNWSNYVVTARIIPTETDNDGADGHGILLRYQNETNFYRVAVRSRTSDTGPYEGLSIQKVVDGVWAEIYHDEPVRFDPPSGVPYEITALIVGNRLQIRLVADPAGAPEVFTYGPFDITGPTVPSGKIGLFNWATTRAEFDFVRVYGIEGVPLQVSSAFGSPTPAVGLHGFDPGSSVTASVPSPVEEFPGVRRVATGWIGTGSVPASGTGSTTTFTLNEISSITWNWVTEVRLNATASAGGQVSAPTGEWLPEGTNVTVTAQPNAGFVFAGWSGDLASAEPVLNLRLVRPYSINARFEADSDADTLPDSWEQTFFNGLTATATADADADGKTNLEELRRGTNPNHAETQVSDDGLSSRWINVQRDPGLPGQLVVRDWGNGFRGVWENSNDYREAVGSTGGAAPIIPTEWQVPNVSFEGPRIVIRTDVWQPAWNDSTVSAIFSVGDNDGNCVYFRYKDESNWYRVTVNGADPYAVWRAPLGVSVQKRFNGVFTELGVLDTIWPDPTDVGGWKRMRATVTAQGPNFEVRVAGWNTTVTPAVWDTATEAVLTFTDSDIPEGRVGVGTWGQSGGNAVTPSNPMATGALIEDVVITVAGQELFREEWDQIPLAAELPAGWTNPNVGGSAGNWQVTAHETILQTANYSTATTGTLVQPRADGETTILLAPAPGVANYFLEVGFHPFDDDGIGFVYDFQDTNSYSRVLFVSEASGNGRVPQGVSVSRKSAGVWSDIFAGDNTFVYTNGSPFAIEFANNNGQFRLRAWHVDSPSTSQSWGWTGPASSGTNRFGLATWGETDAHFTHARALSLPVIGSVPQEVSIGAVSVSGGNVTLTISKPEGVSYTVEQSTTLQAGSWTAVAQNQTGNTWTGPLPQGTTHAFWRLRMNP